MVGPEKVGGGGKSRDRPLTVILGEDPSITYRLWRRMQMLYIKSSVLSTHFFPIPAMHIMHDYKI
jgi:hypothetical protein